MLYHTLYLKQWGEDQQFQVNGNTIWANRGVPIMNCVIQNYFLSCGLTLVGQYGKVKSHVNL